MAKYNPSNSLSPMMFKKTLKAGMGTRSERMRSRSFEYLAEGPLVDSAADRTMDALRSRGLSVSPVFNRALSVTAWKEIGKVKSTHPVIACLLPPVSRDFVASCLLAVGATPLITEEPDDVRNDLDNCKAVLVDVSAPRDLIESYLDSAGGCSREVPVILVASCCGSNDRKKDLALRVLDNIKVTMVTGRNGDIVAVAQGVLEKEVSPLDSLSDVSDEELCKSVPKLEVEDDLGASSISLPPVLRRAKKNQRSRTNSPVPSASEAVANGGRCGGERSREHSPMHARSPPPPSHRSPRASPRSSPVASPRGVKKFLKKKSHAIERVPTLLPRVAMKGQFRETQMSHIKVEESFEHAQKLCTRASTFVHLYETNTVTSGEVVLEITNSQIGMGNLHSTLACSAAVCAAVLACIDPEQSDKVEVEHCGHALSLYYVAAHEAGKEATKGELVSPGTLRQTLIDILHRLSAEDVKRLATIVPHVGGLKTK